MNSRRTIISNQSRAANDNHNPLSWARRFVPSWEVLSGRLLRSKCPSEEKTGFLRGKPLIANRFILWRERWIAKFYIRLSMSKGVSATNTIYARLGAMRKTKQSFRDSEMSHMTSTLYPPHRLIDCHAPYAARQVLNVTQEGLHTASAVRNVNRAVRSNHRIALAVGRVYIPVYH